MAPHSVVVGIAMVIKADVVLPHPKPLGSQIRDAKVEDEAAWTKFTLIFAVVHRLALRRRLRFRFVTLDRYAPIFGMELSEWFVLFYLGPRNLGVPRSEDIVIWLCRGRHLRVWLITVSHQTADI